MAKRVHFLGIGGSGASACAAIASSLGYEVTGCDLEPNNEFTTKFKKSQLLKGHNPKHLKDVDILAVTPAIYSLDPQNPELVAAKKLKIPIMTWQKFLGKYLTKDKFVIAVAGTHGKTTTTAMIAKILEDAGCDPTVLLGAIVPWWGTNYRIGTSREDTNDESRRKDSSLDTRYSYPIFVIEADEYNDNFLAFKPDISVVTNIEMDHPEYFKDFKAYKESFKKFLAQTKGTVIDKVKNLIDFSLKVPGEFNRWNASAAYQVGLALKIDPKTIRKSLSTYPGIGRRFEYLGDFKGAKVYSDFGHHPTEIKETMQAAKELFPKSRLWLIYEPHMFTRTKAFFNDFVKVFKEVPVDKIIITDIYPSREADTGLVSSQQLVDVTSDDRLVYHTKSNLKRYLENQIQKGDILFFMGAGEIDTIAKDLVE